MYSYLQQLYFEYKTIFVLRILQKLWSKAIIFRLYKILKITATYATATRRPYYSSGLSCYQFWGFWEEQMVEIYPYQAQIFSDLVWSCLQHFRLLCVFDTVGAHRLRSDARTYFRGKLLKIGTSSLHCLLNQQMSFNLKKKIRSLAQLGTELRAIENYKLRGGSVFGGVWGEEMVGG